jgi:hypothetical protein
VIDERDVSNLFHRALDAEPSAGAFQRLQLELQSASGTALQRRARRTFVSRSQLVLIAAALVALLIVSLFVGARLYRDLSSQVPASQTHYQKQVAALMARPLNLSPVWANDAEKGPSGGNCLDGPQNHGWYGGGPVFAKISPAVTTTTWGSYAIATVIVPPGLPGPVVFRGMDVVEATPLVVVGPRNDYGSVITAGPIYGTDQVGDAVVKQYRVLVMDTDHPPPDRYQLGGIDYLEWRVEIGFPKGGPSCAGFQVDGTGLSEIFYDSYPFTDWPLG